MSTKEPIFEGMCYREEIRKHPTVKDYVLAKKETVSRKARDLEFYPTNMEWFGSSLKRFGSAMSGHPELCDRTPVFPLVAGQVAQQLFGISLSDFYSDPKIMVKMAVAAAELYDMAPFATAIYADYWCEDYGGKVQWPTGEYMSAPAIMEYPLKTAEDVENLHIWDVDEMDRYRWRTHCVWARKQMGGKVNESAISRANRRRVDTQPGRKGPPGPIG